MIYKYTKCEPVIAKIMADAQLGEYKFRVTDIKEWIFEAIEKIGAPMQYIQRESGVDGCPVLPICEGQIPIPSDLHRLSTVAYSPNKRGPWVPVRTSDSSFKQHQFPKHHLHPIPEECPLDNADKQPDSPVLHRTITSNCQLYGINTMKYVDRILGDGRLEDPVFFIKPGWIVINRKKGFIKLAYSAIATDERGYPLIPDSASYQEAIYWYVMMKLSFPKFLKGTLGSPKAPRAGSEIYSYLQHQWNFYRNQAYAEAMMPTESEMRSIKDEWNKLVPDYNSDEVFFKSEGEKQLNYTDYYYGY